MNLQRHLLSIITKITARACAFVFGKVWALALVPAHGVMRSNDGEDKEDCGCGGKCDCGGVCDC